MHVEAFYTFCSTLPGAEETFPFNEETLVFKVKGKIFALANIDDFHSVTLKCDPYRSLELRARYAEIEPGYHMNKKHWNTVAADGNLSDDLIRELIRHSYELVVAKLPGYEQQALGYTKDK